MARDLFPKPIVEFMHDGGGLPHIPSPMGMPRRNHPEKGDQLIGTALEQKTELAGRVCYDSLGKGRSSEEYHEHIIDVGHDSVWGHSVQTFLVESPHIVELAETLANQPGVVVSKCKKFTLMRMITINLRTLFHHTKRIHKLRRHDLITDGVLTLWEDIIIVSGKSQPQITGKIKLLSGVTVNRLDDPDRLKYLSHDGDGPVELLDGQADMIVQFASEWITGDMIPFNEIIYHPMGEEILSHGWTTWYLGNLSRGWALEWNRHGWQTAISQRSTRYVKESDSLWAWHPLIQKYIEDPYPLEVEKQKMKYYIQDVDVAAREAYDHITSTLKSWLMTKSGADKLTARKQARGAARGALCNALTTEMIWSVSFNELINHIFKQRCSPFADGEIRSQSMMMYEEVKARWPGLVRHLKRVKCDDGISDALELDDPFLI